MKAAFIIFLLLCFLSTGAALLTIYFGLWGYEFALVMSFFPPLIFSYFFSYESSAQDIEVRVIRILLLTSSLVFVFSMPYVAIFGSKFENLHNYIISFLSLVPHHVMFWKLNRLKFDFGKESAKSLIIKSLLINVASIFLFKITTNSFLKGQVIYISYEKMLIYLFGESISRPLHLFLLYCASILFIISICMISSIFNLHEKRALK